jgi:H+/Cl- antiporter ClcA
MLAAFLLLGALFGFLGYREARNFARDYGRSPWGLDPVFWGLIVFFAGIFIGGILLLIARRSTKRSLQQGQTFAQQPYAQPNVPQQAFAPVTSDSSNPYAAPVATSPVSDGRHPGSMDILPGR